jgi:hypothetical protein
MLKRFKFEPKKKKFVKLETCVNLDLSSINMKKYVDSSYYSDSNSTYEPYGFVVKNWSKNFNFSASLRNS